MSKYPSGVRDPSTSDGSGFSQYLRGKLQEREKISSMIDVKVGI